MNRHPRLWQVLCFLALAAPAVQAATIYWDDGDGGSGTISSAGWNDIQTAIRNAEGGPGTIGTVKLSGDFTRSDAVVGTLKITNGWIQLSGGWDSGFTTQSGKSRLNVNGGYKACMINATNVALSNVILTGGYLTASYDSGSGVSIGGSAWARSVYLTDCVVSNNTTGNGYGATGGGVAVNNADDVVLLRCDIVNNVSSADGGGLRANAHVGDSGKGLVLDSCTIRNNSATGNGGGLHIGWANDPSVANRALFVNSRILSNTAAMGAGVFLTDQSGSGGVVLYGCLIQGNRQAGANSIGMGIFKKYNTTAYVVNSTVVDNINTADATRNGIFVSAGWYGSAALRVINSVVAGNHGVFVNSGSGYLDLQRSTIREATYNQGTFSDANINNPITVTATTNSFAGALALASPRCRSINDAGTVTQNIEQNLETDPLFLGMGNTPYVPTPGSPCIDSGLTKSNAGYTYVNVNVNGGSGGTYDALFDIIVAGTPPAGTNFVYTTDLLGAPRITAGALDRGAYEFTPPSLWIANVGGGNILPTTADLIGNLTTGSAPVTVICYWGPIDGGPVAGAWAHADNLGTQSPGYITNSVTGLTSGQAYYFRYYATNSTGESWAISPASFITLGAAAVNNAGGASSVGTSSATLNGTVTSGNPLPYAWIYWGTSDGGTNPADWGQSIAIGQPGLTTFSAGLSGLLANTQYWYRCFASNAYGTAWAAASASFTTIAPTLTATPVSSAVVQGPAGTTTSQTYTVSLSATSALPVSVNYATADGTATVAYNGYVPAAGILWFAPGTTTSTVTVTVNGTNAFKLTGTFYVNFTTPTNVTIGTAQVSCTISSGYTPVYYVRGDGSGSDSNDGSSWALAFASLSNALAKTPVTSLTRDQIAQSTPFRILVQASAPGQAYQVAARATSAALDLDIEGGWVNVAGAPAQGGVSVVRDVTTNSAGISITSASHYGWRRLLVNGFVFTNVTRGVEVSTPGNTDRADVLLIVSNTMVFAKNDGIYINYAHTYVTAGWGGRAQLTADNLAVKAGQGGSGHGVYIRGAWQGSSITASGTNAATHVPLVSSITSANGSGVYCTGHNQEARDISVLNTVIYGCTGNGIYLDCAIQGGQGAGTQSNRVMATLLHCTVADNGGDAVGLVSSMASSWAHITNSIVANNGGHGVNMVGGPVFACSEDYNVFFNDDVWSNGVSQAFASHTSTADPFFYGQRAKPDPWYLVSSALSPAYKRASDGGNRGAYQSNRIAGGTIVLFR